MDFRKVSIIHPFFHADLTVGHRSLKRDGNGKFYDGALAEILQNATGWSAAAFQARGTPEVLRVVEILSIEQGREWGTCSVCYRLPLAIAEDVDHVSQLNEFRKFMGLRRTSLTTHF